MKRLILIVIILFTLYSANVSGSPITKELKDLIQIFHNMAHSCLEMGYRGALAGHTLKSLHDELRVIGIADTRKK